jgi:hypothetical protein
MISGFFLPVVAIEHENHRNLKEIWWDFYKVCFAACPLRVFIGYANRPKKVADSLVDLYETHEFRRSQLPQAETLIMIGERAVRAQEMRWEVRLLHGNNAQWESPSFTTAVDSAHD